MDIQVPLKLLKFGQEDGAGINARVVGREQDIASLAANILARGQIENLVVKRFDEHFYSVSNGNRRLAAFRMMYGDNSDEPISCTLREVDEDGAFEDSLATAVTAKQLHPVDQYEAFARLAERGKNHEEIARQYGLKEKEVRQALALGDLAPSIRAAWRADEINADVAQAFTLAADHKQQEKVYKKLSGGGGLYSHTIRKELGIKSDREMAQLLGFVGIQAYCDHGGKVVEDLFNDNHSISDEALLKKLATDKIDLRCGELVADGWAWAKPKSDLPAGAWHWERKEIPAKKLVYLDGEQDQLAALRKQVDAIEEAEEYDYEAEGRLGLQIETLEGVIRARSFSPADKAKLGCIVDLESGEVDIQYGVIKPAEKSIGDEKRETASGSKPSAPAPVKELTTISTALSDRLSQQLATATLKALQAEKHPSPLAALLAAIISSQIEPERPNWMPPKVSSKLADVRAAISTPVMNDAVAAAFDAKDYFNGAPKPVLLKAISEGINADESRKLKDRTKAEIAKFALANLPKVNWLPKELRTPHYAGPGATTVKKPVAAGDKKASAKKTAAKPVAKKAAKKKSKR